jgi:hypothetical protein
MMVSSPRKAFTTAALVAGLLITGAAVLAQQNTAPPGAMPTNDGLELLEAQLGIKKGGVMKAEAQMELAKANLARQDRMLKRGPNFVSKEEYEKAVAEVAIAEALREIAQAELKETEVRIAQAKRLIDLGVETPLAKATSPPSPTAARALEGRLLNIERKLDLILKRLDASEKAPHTEKAQPLGN